MRRGTRFRDRRLLFSHGSPSLAKLLIVRALTPYDQQSHAFATLRLRHNEHKRIQSIVSPKGNASRHKDFIDHAFTNDQVKLIFHLSPQSLQPGLLRSAPKLLRIAFSYDRANAV